MMKSIIKKIGIVILFLLLIAVLGFIIFKIVDNNKLGMSKIVSNQYNLSYDTGWNLKKKTKNKINLVHNSGSTLDIEIVDLISEYKYESIDSLVDEIVYKIQNNNKEYKFVSKDKTTFGKYGYDGYQLLYEKANENVEVYLYKKSDKLVIFNYNASFDYFDILLDSVHNIIYNFDVKEEEYALNYKVDVPVTKVSFEKNRELDLLLKDTKEEENSNNHYLVKYSLPSNFTYTNFNSVFSTYKINDLNNCEVQLTTSIYNKNIYTYLSKDYSTGIYGSSKYYKSNSDYKDYKEALSKINKDKYIYKNSYKLYDKLHNTVRVVQALDKDHIFVVEVDSSKCSISKKLVDMIKLEKSTKYSSMITSKKKGNYLVGTLNMYKDYKYNTYYEVKLKLPVKFSEIDKGFMPNYYEEKNYVLDYIEDKDIYKYEVDYKLGSYYNDGSIIKVANGSFSKSGKYDYLKKVGDLTVKDKKIRVYSGGYTDNGGTISSRYKYYKNINVLIYNFGKDKYLSITIKGNGYKISEEMMKELINFEITEKNER